MKLDPVVREKHMFIDFSNLQKIESARHKTDQKGFIFPCKMDVYESFFTARQSGRLFFAADTKLDCVRSKASTGFGERSTFYYPRLFEAKKNTTNFHCKWLGAQITIES